MFHMCNTQVGQAVPPVEIGAKDGSRLSPVLRQKELVQQAINLQQPVAVQQQPLSVERQESLRLQLTNRCSKPAINISPEFTLEVSGVDFPQLHLQDQLLNHALFIA